MSEKITGAMRRLVLRILAGHRLMAVATNRADGWPQATTVGYVNEGLLLYFFVARTSQKYLNIEKDRRVSVCITGDFSAPADIRGLSLAGLVDEIQDEQDYSRLWRRFLEKCPEFASWPDPNRAMAPLLRITPIVISLIDYSKEFGHSELVSVSTRDLRQNQD